MFAFSKKSSPDTVNVPVVGFLNADNSVSSDVLPAPFLPRSP